MQKLTDTNMQKTDAILTATAVPIISANTPRIELPIGAVPKKTNVKTLIALPLRLSGVESCIKLFAVARKLTSPHPIMARKIMER